MSHEDHNFFTGPKIIPVEIEEPATVPAESLDAALRAYQWLESQIAPAYRKARQMERSRDNWRYLAVGLLVLVSAMAMEAIR